MKMKSILVSMLALAALAGCSKDDQDAVTDNTPTGDDGIAYVSVQVNVPTGVPVRSSSEQGASPQESKVSALYAIAFDDNDKVIVYEKATPAPAAAQELDISGNELKPKAFCVSSKAKGLLLVANPGSQLKTVLNDAKEGMTFDVLNAAITKANVDEIADTTAAGHGFTMINSGVLAADQNDITFNSKLCLTDISDKMKLVGDGSGQYASKEKAQQAAEEDGSRVKVGLERLAAKYFLTEKQGGAAEAGQIFTFNGWTLDVVNTTFFPYAKKINSGTAVSNDPKYYTNNFYTVDPNYTDNAGLAYNTVVNGVPCVPDATDPATQAVKWLGGTDSTYCIENTMQSSEQRFKNATRVIIKGVYYPNDQWKDDWFSYGGNDYKDFDALKTAYGVATNVNLRAACDKFYEAVKDYLEGKNVDVTGLKGFKTLTTDLLDQVENGGQIVKSDECVRWYQDGLNYYWYELRHDDGNEAVMEFAKYGSVRNNWYNLTINSVKNPGTPWYPEVLKPGPGDPDPNDPIDEQEGYIGITVNVAPWVQWSYGIDF